MRQFLAIVVLWIPLSANAAGFCERQPIDPEVPAGLAGSYEIIGKTPGSGESYVGTLLVSYGKSAYALTRTIGRTAVNGDAWLEHCSPDRIRILVVRYYTKPAPLEAYCTLGADGNNYYRTTCRTSYGARRQGLESWFQTP